MFQTTNQSCFIYQKTSNPPGLIVVSHDIPTRSKCVPGLMSSFFSVNFPIFFTFFSVVSMMLPCLILFDDEFPIFQAQKCQDSYLFLYLSLLNHIFFILFWLNITNPSHAAACRQRNAAEMLCLGAAIDGVRQARAELQVLRAHALSILAEAEQKMG